MKESRSYSEELKSEAVKMVNEQGLSREETATCLMIPKGTIGNLVTAAKAGKQAALPRERSHAELIAENNRHRKELSDIWMEREILKKATAYNA